MMDVLRHLFLPHHTNNHRAKVLHIDAMTVYVVLFAVINIGIRVVHQKLPDVLGYATDIYADQLLIGTNNQRVSAGLKPLTINTQLSQAAALKAQDMFAHSYWAHNSPQGKTPWEFITAAGYRYTVAGENLAKNFTNSQGVVDAWMASPTHRENLLKTSYREVGFAIVNGVLNGEETTLVVQMFGASNAPAPAAKVEVPKESAKTVAVNTELPVKSPDVALAAQPIPAVAPAQTSIPTSQINTFNGVTLRPFINLNNATRGLAYAFIGFLLCAFILDAYIVARRGVVRVTGHNLAHVLFLVSISIALAVTVPGAII